MQPLQLAVVVASGAMFGIAQLMGKIAEPALIQSQMRFEGLEMVKMFLAAMATSSAALALLGVVGEAQYPALNRKWQTAYDSCKSDIASSGWLGAFLGGSLLGSGMRLSGACPGTVWVQLGAHIPNAALTLLGCLAGAFLFRLCADYCRTIARWGTLTHVFWHEWLTGGKSEADDSAAGMVCGLDGVCYMPGSAAAKALQLASRKLPAGYPQLALALSGTLAALAAALQLAFPVTAFSGLTQQWPPYLTGVAVGALQLPYLLAASSTMGSTGAYRAFVSLVKGEEVKSGKWQLVFATGAIVGGLAARQVLDAGGVQLVGAVSGVQAFGGGVAVVLGSSIANGCTSGHGLSGVSFLAVPSVFTIGGIFAGGGATSALLAATG